MRCRPRLTAPGDSTWITRSTAPMSMPSSRLRRGHDGPQLPLLQLVLDDDPLLAGERAVVGLAPARPTSPGSMPSFSASSFSRAASRSACRRALQKMIVVRCGEDQLEDARVDRRPDAGSCGPTSRPWPGRCAARPRLLLAELAHVLDGNDDFDLERLADAGIDDRAPAGACREPSTRRGTGRPPPADAAWPRARCAAAASARDLLEPLERQHQMGAALGGGEGVDLVDDHRLDRRERLRAPTR